MEAKFRAELQRDLEETCGPKKKFEAHGDVDKKPFCYFFISAVISRFILP